ncbi:MAG: DUF373 family protein [Desulfurococcales archaeon]|nr:DUF373 family protein [Desulfurococcales archaeon]
MEKNGRIPLVLVIDVDDDVSEVLGEPVIVGEDRVREAALRYGEERPEDADVNAMLAGLNLYKRLGGRGNAEIAVVGGHSIDIVEAQRLIKERVSRIIEDLRSRTGRQVELYLVSDGEDELMISEVLRDLAPITGLKRVVIEQHLGIEGSYILVFRYIKKAMFDPRFSKYFMGIPGLTLLVLSLLSLVGLLDIAIKLALAILGASMVVRGFNLEGQLYQAAYSIVTTLRMGHPLQIAGVLVGTVALLGSLVAAALIASTSESPYQAIASTLKYPLPSLMAGVAGYILLARLLYKVVNEDLVVFREASMLILASGVAMAFYSLGSYLESSGPQMLDPGALASGFIESGFVSYIIIASGIAAIIEAVGRTLQHRLQD